MMQQYLIPWILGVLSMVYAYRIDKNYLRVDFSAIKSFLLFMLWVSLFRAITFTVQGGVSVPYLNSINPVTLLGVFSEDAIFVLPLVLLRDKGKLSKFVYAILFAISAALFSLGHMYQGLVGFTSIIYLFASAHFGRKFGFGTVMIGHILYDFITVAILSIYSIGHL
jgi:hypothetical protein